MEVVSQTLQMAIFLIAALISPAQYDEGGMYAIDMIEAGSPDGVEILYCEWDGSERAYKLSLIYEEDLMTIMTITPLDDAGAEYNILAFGEDLKIDLSNLITDFNLDELRSGTNPINFHDEFRYNKYDSTPLTYLISNVPSMPIFCVHSNSIP